MKTLGRLSKAHRGRWGEGREGSLEAIPRRSRSEPDEEERKAFLGEETQKQAVR